MGYTIYFNLESIKGPEKDIKDFYTLLDSEGTLNTFLSENKELFFMHWSRAEVEEIKNLSYIRTALLDCEGCTWYEHTEDMEKISKLFPELTIIISGEGEEQGDVWREKFCNGKHELSIAEIVYPDFSF